jgi:hypothetical protein
MLLYVEQNRNLIALSQPPKGETTYFDFIQDAQKRGAAVEVYQGEHRKTLAERGGDKFYHLIVVETVKDGKHEHLYADLLTREGMQMLIGKLVEEGVLCYHTSHRYVDVQKLVASVAKDCGFAYREGHDSAQWDKERGHFSSQWVMVARKAEYLKHLKEPVGYKAPVPGQNYWSEPVASDRFVWKDGQRNTLAGLWRANPYVADLRSMVRKVQMSIPIGFQQSEAIFRPVYQRIDALDRLVVTMQNR